MKAPREAVEAVEKALGCMATPIGLCASVTHNGQRWTQRGCLTAVRAADAAVDALGLVFQVSAWECSCGGIGYVHHHGQPSHVATASRFRLVGPWREDQP